MVEGSELSERRLAHLEAVIHKYRQDFYAVGKALNEIRDARHYQKLCFTTLLCQITIAQNDRWRSTTQRSAVYWNKVMKEKILWG